MKFFCLLFLFYVLPSRANLLQCVEEQKNWETQCPEYSQEKNDYLFLIDGFDAYSPVYMCLQKTQTSDVDLLYPLFKKFQKETRRRNGKNLIRALYSDKVNTSFNDKLPFGYYSYSQRWRIRKCIKKIVKLNPSATFHFIGYSMGAGSVIRVLKTLSPETQIGHVLTIDTFRPGFKAIANLTGKTWKIKNIDSWRTWSSLYQVNDYKSGFLFGYKGSKLLNSKISNKLFSKENLQETGDENALKMAHKFIMKSPRLYEILSDFLDMIIP